ncbi:hypothetical protein protein [Bacillus cereus G9241]|nr:hypothetical protein protein [Bacillus cereus G9241]
MFIASVLFMLFIGFSNAPVGCSGFGSSFFSGCGAGCCGSCFVCSCWTGCCATCCSFFANSSFNFLTCASRDLFSVSNTLLSLFNFCISSKCSSTNLLYSFSVYIFSLVDVVFPFVITTLIITSKATIPINAAKIFFLLIINPPKCKITRIIITDTVMFFCHIMSN